MAPRTVQEEREKLKRLSPLLVTTELPESWTEVKLEFTRENGTIGKESLPTTKAESAEHILYCLTEFNKAAEEHGWAGAVRFTKYRKTLKGAATTKFDAARNENPGNNIASFRACIRHMIKTICGREGHTNFTQYMQHVKKPKNMEVADFIERMLLLYRYSVYLTLEDGSEPEPVPT